MIFGKERSKEIGINNAPLEKKNDIIKANPELSLDDFLISDFEEENVKDIHECIKMVSNDKRIEQYLEKYKISKREFLLILEKKSEGNFLYLKYIFREILNGRYKEIKLSELPQGLDGYYKEHWNRKMAVSDAVKELKLKVIYLIANIGESISSEDLTEIIESGDKTVKNIQIKEVINDWSQFLRETFDDVEEEKEYTFYHKSFLDFLASDYILKTVGKDYSKTAQRIELDFYNKNIDALLEWEDEV